MKVNPGVVGSAGHEHDPLLFSRVVVTADFFLRLLVLVAQDAGLVSRASCTVYLYWVPRSIYRLSCCALAVFPITRLNLSMWKCMIRLSAILSGSGMDRRGLTKVSSHS